MRLVKSCLKQEKLNLMIKLKKICNFKLPTFVKNVFCFSIFYLISVGTFGNTLELTLEEYVKEPFGQVLFLRHALAPGFDANGKPDKFNIDDCSTQRNLNATGRKQAIQIGENFVKYGLRFRKIYSSQWCRCLETAELLKLGEVIPESSLNSGFKGIFNKEKSLSTLRNILEALNNENESILMVTHYGTISAMTGINVDSGGAVAYDVKTRISIKISLK